MEVVAKSYWVAFSLLVALLFMRQAWRAHRSRLVNPLRTYLALAASGLLTAYLLAALGAATIGLLLGALLHFNVSVGPVQAFVLASLGSLILTLLLAAGAASATVRLAGRRQPPNNSSKPTPLRGAA